MMLDAAAHDRCSYEQVLEWLCHAPARVYGIVDRHRLEVGSWADLVVIDPKLERIVRDEEQFSRCAWSPWRGRQLKGWPVMTFVNGQLAFSYEGDGAGTVHDGRGVEVQFG